MLKASIVLATLLLASLVVPSVGAVSVEDARGDLARAYVAVASAEAAGGNVTALTWRLDEAASVLNGGSGANVTRAEGIIGEVLAAAPQIQSSGAQRITNRYIVTGVALVVLAAAGVLVWFRGSGWYWATWLRFRRGWRVERV